MAVKAAKQEEQERPEQRTPEGGPLEGAVRDSVMGDLGRPEGLQRVQVRSLWNGRYRVNVLVGPDAVSCKVAHSFFLQADACGKVLWSVPDITRLY
jgi:hypothetical protein